jgi:hypothetical protein
MLTTSTAQPHWETMTSHQEFATSMDPAFPLSAGRGKRSAMTLVIGFFPAPCRAGQRPCIADLHALVKDWLVGLS